MKGQTKTEPKEGLGSKIDKIGARLDRVLAALEKNERIIATLERDAVAEEDEFSAEVIASYPTVYAVAGDLGPSVFSTIMDTLDLDPRYKPHRNADAVRMAKLMSKLIKMKLCKRAMNEDGRLGWRFLEKKAYDTVIETLTDHEKAIVTLAEEEYSRQVHTREVKWENHTSDSAT